MPVACALMWSMSVGCKAGEFDRPGHRVAGLLTVRIGRHDVVAVRGDAGAHQPGDDVGTACLGVLFGLDDQERAALAEHKTVAIPVEGSACTGRVIVGGGQHDPHLCEPRDRNGLDHGLDAAADRDIRLTEHDVAPCVRDRLGAGGAGRNRRHDPGFGVPLQPDGRRRPVRHVHLHDQRRHRPQPPRPHAVVREEQFLGGSQAGADRHHQPLGIDVGLPGVFPGAPADHRRHLLQIRQPAQLDPRQLTVEILQEMPADADGQVELLDERVLELSDPALAVQQSLPRSFRIGCQGSRHRNAGDNNVREAVPRSQPTHFAAMVPFPPTPQYLPKASATLCPPNPNELLIAYL